MNNNLHYFRSELKSKSIHRYKMIGIVSELILSKEVFQKNKDIIPFLQDIFDVEYKKYVMQTRTLVIARTTRLVYEMDEKQYGDSRQKLLKYIQELQHFLQGENIRGNKSEHSISKWIEGNLND